MSRVFVFLVGMSLFGSSLVAQQFQAQTSTVVIENGPGGITGGIVAGPFSTFPEQPLGDSQLVTGQSILRGRVLTADTAVPVRRALVRVSAPELRGQRTTQTDGEGRYEIRDLPGGRYSVSASKPAFIN